MFIQFFITEYHCIGSKEMSILRFICCSVLTQFFNHMNGDWKKFCKSFVRHGGDGDVHLYCAVFDD